MGYAGKLELKFKARQLRGKGFSVKAIQKLLGVSRSSVSIWIRDVRLTNGQIRKLYLNKRTGALKGSIVAAMNKVKKREKLTQELLQKGIKEVGRLSQRDRFIAGIALYLAEGAKTDRNVYFSNADPAAINFMMKWLKEFGGVSDERFHGALYIHDNLDRHGAEKFWSNLTKIPLKQFTKTYIVKNNPRRLRKVRHIYGVFRISVSDAAFHRRIMGWIAGLMR